MKSTGDYDQAASHFQIVLAQYPHDRVALNNLGRVCFLQRKYADAVKVLQQALAVGSRGPAGALQPYALLQRSRRQKMSKEHQARYVRFKADEASQAITGPYRQLNPEDTMNGRVSTSTYPSHCQS